MIAETDNIEFGRQCFFYNADTDEEKAILPEREWHHGIRPFPYPASTWTMATPQKWTEEVREEVRANFETASLMPFPGDDEEDLF